MSERAIIVYGHPTLRLRAAPVTVFDDRIVQLVADLFDSMYADRGMGLAAPQIDVSLRVIVVDPTRVSDEGTRVLALINPEILSYAGSATLEEGCLSIPGIYAEVNRPTSLRVRYRDLKGHVEEEDFSGLMARVILHESDHLDGRLFIDRLSPMRRSLLTRRLRALDQERRRENMRL